MAVAAERQPAVAAERQPLPPLSTVPVLAIASAVTTLLIAFSGRYGYHRDELYFLAAGKHLAWGYPDQPPFVPAIARLMSEIAPGSLVAFRLPSALAAAAVVVLTALTARELGGGRSAQVLAAGAMAAAPILLGASHLLSTTTFDLVAWSALVWLVVRTLRTGDDRGWLLVGVVAGIGLLDKGLVAFLVAALLAGIAVSGPRRTFASPWLWAGGAIAAVLWAPYLIWQARHGWPQLDVASSIAGGGSGTSEPRWAMLPFQIGLVSPYLAPVWIAGLVRLFRDPALRWCRSVGWAYVVLVVVLTAMGGKPYYLAGMFPVLLAAGAQPTIDWLHRGRERLRRGLIAAAFALTAVGSVAITMPVLPLDTIGDTPIVDLNYDTGETIGWPGYVDEIAAVYHRMPAAERETTAIVGSNYGESGAVDRYGPARGLPSAYGGLMGYWYWGPPPESATTVMAIGYGRAFLERSFGRCDLAARLHNAFGVDNDEQNTPVWQCTDRRGTWAEIWPRFQDLG